MEIYRCLGGLITPAYSAEVEYPCLSGERRHLPCINFKDSARPAELPRWLSWYSICLAEHRRFESHPRQLFFFSAKKELSSGVVACICLVSITDYSCTSPAGIINLHVHVYTCTCMYVREHTLTIRQGKVRRQQHRQIYTCTCTRIHVFKLLHEGFEPHVNVNVHVHVCTFSFGVNRQWVAMYTCAN